MLKTLESYLYSKEIKPVNPKGNQPLIFIGRTDAEAPILWPPDAKSQLVGKDPDAGKYWRQEEKGTTEDEMVGWHHWLNGYEFEQALGDGEGQGSLAWCSLWGHKESNITEQLENNSCCGVASCYKLLNQCPICGRYQLFWVFLVGRLLTTLQLSWDFNSHTRDWAWAFISALWSPNHWITREFPDTSLRRIHQMIYDTVPIKKEKFYLISLKKMESYHLHKCTKS